MTFKTEQEKFAVEDDIDIFPDVVRIETSGVCNFRCSHCANGLNPPQRKILSAETFDCLLKQFEVQNFVPRVVVLYHGGEPLLNENTPFFIRRFTDLGVKKTKITTNCSLLTKEIAQKLIDSGLSELYASFDGISPEQNDSIRIGSNFERDSQNLLNLLELCEAQDADLRVTIANVQVYDEKTLENQSEEYFLKNIPDYLKSRFEKYKKFLKYESYPARIWPGYDIENTTYSAYKLQKKISPPPCPTVFETISVLSNGNVVPCCNDLTGEVVFGNILADTIFNIWGNKKSQAFRNMIKKAKPPKFCQKCLHYSNEYLVKKEKIHAI